MTVAARLAECGIKRARTYSTAEAAAVCRVDPDTVRYWIERGYLKPSRRRRRGRHRIPHAELERLATSGAIVPANRKRG